MARQYNTAPEVTGSAGIGGLNGVLGRRPPPNRLSLFTREKMSQISHRDYNRRHAEMIKIREKPG